MVKTVIAFLVAKQLVNNYDYDLCDDFQIIELE